MPHKPPINDARPFGTVRIVEVEAHQSVAEPVGILAHNPQRGDRIIGRIQKSAEKNPPPENVEGLVGSVDASGLMTLTIGSDAGLTKGHTLELFRLNPSEPSQSKYLGTVRILEAEAHQSVAQPVGRLSSPPQRGDRVASRLLGN
jgi:hypothetical protein